MNIQELKEKLRRKNKSEDVVIRFIKKLVEYHIVLNYKFAIEEIGSRTIKKIEFKDILDEHGIGILVLKYNFIDDEGNDDYVISRVYITNVFFEGKDIFIRFLFSQSFSCSIKNGSKFCNFGVNELVKEFKKVIEDLNTAIEFTD